jgi:hypothetical protein
MKRQELKQRLIRRGVPDDMYSLDGGFPNETYCLNRHDRVWEIYYSEKGMKSGIREFVSEEEACEYFYRLIQGFKP